MDEDIWRPVRGWEGIYDVSDLGRVRRIAFNSARKPTSRLRNAPPERVLTPHVRGQYYSVCLTYGNERKLTWKSIHNLVAEAFLPPRPSRKHTVNHINGKKLDNRATNLDWRTRSQQQRHAMELGLRDNGPYRRLTGEQAREIWARTEVPGREFARRFGVSTVIVSNIRNGKGYRWAIADLERNALAAGVDPAHWTACTRECNCRCHYR